MLGVAETPTLAATAASVSHPRAARALSAFVRQDSLAAAANMVSTHESPRGFEADLNLGFKSLWPAEQQQTSLSFDLSSSLSLSRSLRQVSLFAFLLTPQIGAVLTLSSLRFFPPPR